MPKLGLFDVAVINPLPMRIRAMHSTYGTTPGERCGTCAHLYVRRYNRRYYKCGLTKQTAGPSTDWRVGWEACGRWRSREEADE